MICTRWRTNQRVAGSIQLNRRCISRSPAPNSAPSRTKSTPPCRARAGTFQRGTKCIRSDLRWVDGSL
eukprot:1176789-Prymnesium_polylepis.1